ncbi:VOC family protein [Nocardioides sp. 616]|uniref:VOC family protein n=1 Tax=Nocardioides sp. 616 TaxID=2268090 RepID=UPI000CE55C65|nr:VOC family protein [Nocardioides sp. 616]
MNELTPYLCVQDGRAAIDWYVAALGATVTAEPILFEGRVGHVELARGQARWMLAEEFEAAGVAPPDPRRGAPVSLHLAVDDVDGLCAQVVEAGATLDRGPEDAGPAGRVAVFHDPFGHRWFLNRAPD